MQAGRLRNLGQPIKPLLILPVVAWRRAKEALTGEAGGKLMDYCDVCVRAPARETFRVQEMHLPLYHALCAALEQVRAEWTESAPPTPRPGTTPSKRRVI